MTTGDSHPSGPRSPRQRKREALERLDRDVDVWVATADGRGEPCLVPLAYWWDGRAVWLATRDTNPTGRNLRASGKARLCFGETRDVVLMHGTARMLTREELPEGVGDAFTAKDGWDPRKDHSSYVWFEVTPYEVQAWGTVAENRERFLMRDGEWLV
ncbi:pyridoxamine 5'-phosphate oxidase family protein [Streptomyces sp. ODS28]|uniref:pyridoxamine 5'-phosphate oxidase family protein n=1 Tax=Streptomyces sp. ODS28 TaxID=3136688 RepID=UPI0031E7DDF3